MLHVLAIGSAVALGSLVFRNQSKTLRHKRHLKSNLNAGQTPHSEGSRDLYQNTKKKLLAIRKVLAISMGGTQERDKQFYRLTAQQGKDSSTVENLNLDRRISISIGLMGLAVVGTFGYAPLLHIAGGLTLINNLPVFQELSRNLKKGRITTELLEIVSQISLLVTGYFFLATLVCFIALLDLKLLRRTEEHSHQQLIDQFNQKPHSIWVFVDGIEVEMPLEAVRKNNFVIVNTGEVIPVDGIHSGRNCYY